jgi:hypothetical protein
MLVNFRADPDVVQKVLPEGLRPKLQGEVAIAGICLIRLEGIRPSMAPLPFGFSSENAAHRIAVEWRGDDGSVQEGVYIPRRHTDSALILALGGRLFPGVHERARFDMNDRGAELRVAIRAEAGDMKVALSAGPAEALPSTSVFPSVEAASEFFRGGAVGYSPSRQRGHLEGLRLETPAWRVSPLAVHKVHSSWFEDVSAFPPGSVEFDCALIMRDIEHDWHGEHDLYVDSGRASSFQYR